MKECPFCHKQLPDDDPRPWYFRTPVVVMVILALMPLGLPLVWFNPYYARKIKIAVTVIVLAASYALWVATAQVMSGLQEYYKMLQ